MREQHGAVVLPVPTTRVWKFVTEVRCWPAWLQPVSTVRALTLPKTAAGMRFEVVRSRQPTVETWIVAEWDAPSHVRFTEYRQNIQLAFAVLPAGPEAELRVRLAYPKPRGLLSSLTARLTVGGGWAKGLEASCTPLHAIFVANHDLFLLHNLDGA